MDDECVVFRDPPATKAEVALADPARDYPPFVDLDDPVFGVDEDEVVGFS